MKSLGDFRDNFSSSITTQSFIIIKQETTTLEEEGGIIPQPYLTWNSF